MLYAKKKEKTTSKKEAGSRQRRDDTSSVSIYLCLSRHGSWEAGSRPAFPTPPLYLWKNEKYTLSYIVCLSN